MRCFVVSSTEIEGSRLDCLFNLARKTGGLKSRYRSKPLLKLARSYSGGTPSKDNETFWSGDIPWASPKDFTTFHLHNTEDHITEQGLKGSSAKLVPPGSVLVVVRSGILNHSLPVAITRVPTAINQDIRALIPNPDAELLPEYLATYFAVFGKKLLPLITKHSTTVQSINTDQFSKLPIPLPPLSVQKHIIEIMEAAYERKRQQEKEAQRLLDSVSGYVAKELGIAALSTKARHCFIVPSNVISNRLDPLFYSQDTFSFLKSSPHKVKAIKSISVSLKTGFAAGRSEQELGTGGILQIRPTNIDENGLLKLNTDRSVYVRDGRLRSGDNDLLRRGEVLFNNTNSQELVGKTALLTSDKRLCCSNHVTRIAVDSHRVMPEYLWIVLNLYQRRKVFFNLCTNWNNQSGVNADLLKTVLVPVPSLSVQAKISQEVERRLTEAMKLRSEVFQFIAQAKHKVEALLVGR